jgi:hypothetical protein
VSKNMPEGMEKAQDTSAAKASFCITRESVRE